MRKVHKLRVGSNSGENIDDIISSIDKEMANLRSGGRSINMSNNNNTDVRRRQQNPGAVEDPSSSPSSSSSSYPRAGLANSRGRTLTKNYSDASTEGDDEEDDEDVTLISSEAAANVNAEERKRIVDDIESANKAYTEEKLKTQEEEKKIAEELKKTFESLKKQLEQYKTRYDEAKNKLWDEEDKQVELQEKIEKLQDEIMALQEDLKKTSEQVARSGSDQHRPMRASSEPVRVTDDGTNNNKIRRALLFEDYEQESGDLSYYDKVQNAGFVMGNINELINFLTPFRKDIAKIRSQMGSSVASYFVFMRFIFIHSLLIAGIMSIFLGYHLAIVGVNKFTFATKGLLPGFMLFSSYSVDEAVLYVALILIEIIVSLVIITSKHLSEDALSKELDALENESDQFIYGPQVLCAWDFSLSRKADADDHKGSLTQSYRDLLHEAQVKAIQDSRTNAEYLGLVIRRAVGFSQYLLVQAASFVLIIAVSLQATNITGSINHFSPAFGLLSTFVPGILLSLIDFVTPKLMIAITNMEQWDSAATELNVCMTRMYISSTLNLLLTGFSYALLADPFLLIDQPAIRENLGVNFTGIFPCRFDQIANGLFTTIVSSEATNLILLVLMPNAKQFVRRGFAWPSVTDEFETADRIVNAMKLQGLVMITLPFVPLVVLFVPFFVFFDFKVEQYATLKYRTKPKRPWKAQKAGSVFSLLYLVSIIALGLPAAIFFLATRTFPKNCDIQDNHIGLCVTIPNPQNICLTDPDSPYYYNFGGEGIRGTLSKYPAMICNQACGPFVDISASPVTPFQAAIESVPILGDIWHVFFNYPYLPWLSILLVFVALQRKGNTADVFKAFSYQRERQLLTRVGALEAEGKRQNKIIGRMRAIARAEAGIDDKGPV